MRGGKGHYLRLTLDVKYPSIILEAREAIREARGSHERPPVRKDHRCECVHIASYWRSWKCYLPQHGPGRKHSRKIGLTDWQWRIVERHPEPFLRGLIHTDGWRGVNKVHAKGKGYVYPRYQFSNRSDDIRNLFTDVCDLVGVEWRPWGRWHISVARKDSVAKLDTFIGLKR